MLCTKCGRQNIDGVRFCYGCGHDMAQRSLLDLVARELDFLAALPPAEGVGPSGPTPLEEIERGQLAALQRGVVVAGRWRIERLVGQGDVGAVYLATDEKVGRTVALKFINPERWRSGIAYQRFVQQANVCLDLTYPNIARVYCIEQWEGQAYLAMESPEGETLAAVLDRCKSEGKVLPWKPAVAILEQLLAGVGYAHSRGVIHRDLKPSNIMLAHEKEGRWRVVVMDFGLAQPTEAEQRTEAAASPAVLCYMAPEQQEQAPLVDHRADIYSLGVIAYVMLTGQLPIGRAAPPSSLCKGLPKELDAWVLKAIEPDPRKRFASVGEMLEWLGLIASKAAEETPLWPPTEEKGKDRLPDIISLPVPETRERSTRYRKALVVASCGFCLLLGVGLTLLILSSRDRPTSRVSRPTPTPPPLPWRGVPALPGPLIRPPQLAVTPFIPSITVPSITLPSVIETGPLRLPGVPPFVAMPLSLDLGRGVKLDLVLVGPGSFMMGSERANDEKPVHEVTITKPFYIGKYEVTQQQWEAVMGSNPSYFKGPTNPVDGVSWSDCQTFLKKLSDQFPGTVFRLPTEAEWEYACRAGSASEFCYGDGETGLGDYAWYGDNSSNTTHPVGEKKPNAWGLYDMHGNVWEWCHDWYHSDYTGAPADGSAWESGAGSARVLRGGSWNDRASIVRSAIRSRDDPTDRLNYDGFRVCCPASP